MLAGSAIMIEAGLGKEDRLMAGSYIQLRAGEKQQREAATATRNDFFVPTLDNPATESTVPEPPAEPTTDDSFDLEI